MSDPRVQLFCNNRHPMPRGADWCDQCGHPPAKSDLSAVAPRMICPWCGDDCPRWGADTCPFRPRQLPRNAEEK